MREFDQVVLTRDLTEHVLRVGDIGTVVMVHDRAAGYEVEFMTLAGETIAASTGSQLRPTFAPLMRLGH